MIVRMAVAVLAPLVPEQLQRTVRNHLVGIHVRRRTGAALHHVDHEMLVQPALLDLAAGIDNSRAVGPSSSPRSPFARAAASLTIASARISSG